MHRLGIVLGSVLALASFSLLVSCVASRNALIVGRKAPTEGRAAAEDVLLDALAGNLAAQLAEPHTVVMADLLDTQRCTTELGRLLADRLATRLHATGTVRLVERQQLDQLLQEIHLGLRGLLDEATARRLGHLVGADAVVLGSLAEQGSAVLITLRIVAVEGGQMLASVEGRLLRDASRWSRLRPLDCAGPGSALLWGPVQQVQDLRIAITKVEQARDHLLIGLGYRNAAGYERAVALVHPTSRSGVAGKTFVLDLAGGRHELQWSSGLEGGLDASWQPVSRGPLIWLPGTKLLYLDAWGQGEVLLAFPTPTNPDAGLVLLSEQAVVADIRYPAAQTLVDPFVIRFTGLRPGPQTRLGSP